MLRVIVFATVLWSSVHDGCAASERYFSSSTEDLSRLFKAEEQLFDLFRAAVNDLKNVDDRETLKSFFQATNEYELSKITNGLAYVEHPINAYHLMKRTARMWPALLSNLTDVGLVKKAKPFLNSFPVEEDFDYGALFGLMTLQLYYDLDLAALTSGRLEDPATGKRYDALHSVPYTDCQAVSGVAQSVWRLDKMVDWQKAAVARAKAEGYPSYVTRAASKLLDQAKVIHDDVLVEKGLGATTVDNTPDGQPEVPIFTATRPFDEEMVDIPSYQDSRHFFKAERDLTKMFVDIRPLDKTDSWGFLEGSFRRVWTYLNPVSRRLCKGEADLRPAALDAKLKCALLDYNDPYLRLGPFRYEVLSAEPHVAIFRNFYTERECERFKADARGDLHSTPYQVGQTTRLLNSQRTSKRKHLDDEDLAEAATSSRRISLATRWRVHQHETASEHYHVINYGLGGQIEVHVDYWGPGKHFHAGGARTVTMLGYLSDVEAGGRTIFPQLGLAVKPEKGSMLLWLTAKSDLEFDSRMFHMGCPVLYGSKWVLTKWLYLDDQMWTHPCLVGQQGHNFRPFAN